MAPTQRIPARDREFLAIVRNVVFANPFSEERERVVASLVPGTTLGDLRRDREALVRAVEPRLRTLADGGKLALDRFGTDDRELVKSALLYTCYHRHVDGLDNLIERQLRSQDELLGVPFGNDAIGEMVDYGLSEGEATRYFALFFQLRRAFYFIVGSLVGESASMRELRGALWNNVFTHDMHDYEARLWDRMEDFSTLLLGETGTGKGSAAAAIGRSGFIPYLPERRRFAANFADDFIAINLSQFPETLIESELFGHRKGAFTGAIDHHEGVFERCSAHGALFLDEIGEISIPVQIKLLQVLQERYFMPLGSHERRRFAGRIIAATNRPLDQLRQAGSFRDDFYYRLVSDVIVMPALRGRIEESPGEIDILVGQIVARTTGAEDAALKKKVLEVLRRDLPTGYGWPGNVRELEQAVRRILLTGQYPGDRMPAETDAEDQLVQGVRTGTIPADELLARYCALLYRRYGTYEEVSRRTGLDRRTARKYVLARMS